MSKRTKNQQRRIGVMKKSERGNGTQKEKNGIAKLFEDKNLGVKIDLGCGENKQPGFIGVDFRKGPNVDIAQDITKFPWRDIPDDCASLVMASHVLEHIPKHAPDPRLSGLLELLRTKGIVTDGEIDQYVGDHQFLSIFARFMDEVWRILKPEGQFMAAFPYAGSHGFWQDPSHTSGLNETTFTYFDPLAKNPDGSLINLYTIYRSKPWKIVTVNYNMIGNMEILLEKRRIDPSYRVTTNNNI